MPFEQAHLAHICTTQTHIVDCDKVILDGLPMRILLSINQDSYELQGTSHKSRDIHHSYLYPLAASTQACFALRFTLHSSHTSPIALG